MWRISSSCCTCSSRSVKLTVNHLMWRISSSHSSSSVNHLMWRMRSQPPFFPPTLLIEARAAKRRRHVSCSTRQRGSLTSDKQTSRALKMWLDVTALIRFQPNHPLSLSLAWPIWHFREGGILTSAKKLLVRPVRKSSKVELEIREKWHARNTCARLVLRSAKRKVWRAEN